MSFYKINIDGIAYDVYANDVREALSLVALCIGCHYRSLGRQYYEDKELRDYRFNDLIYYDQIVSSLRS